MHVIAVVDYNDVTPMQSACLHLLQLRLVHPSIIQTAVWLTYRLTICYCDVEERLAERGIDVSFDVVRRWCLKIGPIYARRRRRKRNRLFSVWHMDEVFLKIAGRQHYVWRAVEAEDEVPVVLLQSRCNKAATVRETVHSTEHVVGLCASSSQRDNARA